MMLDLLLYFTIAVVMLVGLLPALFAWQRWRHWNRITKRNQEFPPLTPKDVMELEKLYDKEHKR